MQCMILCLNIAFVLYMSDHSCSFVCRGVAWIYTLRYTIQHHTTQQYTTPHHTLLSDMQGLTLCKIRSFCLALLWTSLTTVCRLAAGKFPFPVNNILRASAGDWRLYTNTVEMNTNTVVWVELLSSSIGAVITIYIRVYMAAVFHLRLAPTP